MNEWLAMLVPFGFAIILLVAFRKATTWWELLLPSAVVGIVIFSCKACSETVQVRDTEYWGSMIVEARYYESYETWVTKTCYRDVPCGTEYYTDANGKTQSRTKYCRESYDCSECESYSAYWEAYDDAGRTYRISQSKYESLIKQWKATPAFVELGRSIVYRFGCGDDGDMYSIKWDGQPTSADAAVTEHSYENKIQASHSAFNLPDISDEQAKQLGLYPYPSIDGYTQRAVLGLEQLYSGDSLQVIERIYQWFNGQYGPKNKIKLFVCLFYDKPYDISFRQEEYWDGGNQNELVVCIGLNKQTKEIKWVRPFSWTNQKRVLVDVREDVSNLKYFKPVAALNVIKATVATHGDMHRSFKKDFNYLEVELPSWVEWMIWILAIVISAGVSIWAIGNEFEGESEERKPTTSNTWYQRSNSYWSYETFGQRFKRRSLMAWNKLKDLWNKR
jgi:hypothetical protein